MPSMATSESEGVAAYALMTALLEALEMKGVFSRANALSVTLRALHRVPDGPHKAGAQALIAGLGQVHVEREKAKVVAEKAAAKAARAAKRKPRKP